MKVRSFLIAIALAAAGCSQQPAQDGAGETAAPQLDAPAPGSEPSRLYAAVNDAARGKASELTISVTQRLPDGADADVQEVLSLRGGGLALEAQITGAISPATQVQGQTLRALLDIPVEEPQVLVYRVTEASGGSLCGDSAASHVVVWEPSGPGDPSLKILGIAGGAPGAADARACPMLEYRRS
jgi:hypothetical protein